MLTATEIETTVQTSLKIHLYETHVSTCYECIGNGLCDEGRALLDAAADEQSQHAVMCACGDFIRHGGEPVLPGVCPTCRESQEQQECEQSNIEGTR